MKNKIFLLLFAIMASCNLLFAESGYIKCLDWTLENGVLTISGYGDMDWDDGEGYYYYYDVSWYALRSSIVAVIINSGVTSIGHDAFNGCNNLSYVSIPSSVTSIGQYAFAGCSSLTSVIVPNSVTSIGEDAFGSTLNVVYYGQASGAPWGAKCVNGYVEGLLVYSDNSRQILKGCASVATGRIAIPNSVTSIVSSAFRNCSGLTYVTIPNSVTSIGSSAFCYCTGLTSVTIPNSVASIGSSAFYGCSKLTFVLIEAETPPTLGGNSVFNGNNKLESIFVPCGTLDTYQNATQWSYYASKIKYQTYTITTDVSNGTVALEPSEYTSCSDVTLTATPNEGYRFTRWSDGNTDNPRTFVLSQDTSLTAEFVASSGTCGKNNALQWSYDNTSHTLTISGTGELTENYTYGTEAPTQMTTLIIGNNVTAVGSSAFKNMSTLDSVIIGNGVTNIGDYAFWNCSSLTSVTIGNSVSSIGNEAFLNCSGLASVHISNIAAWCAISFGNIRSNPLGFSHNLYFNEELIANLVIPDNVTSIGSNAFSNCSSLTSVTIPNSVTSIGSSAFYGCTGLTSVTIPNSVTSIGNSAFNGCNHLTSVSIGSGVTTIGNDAFYKCTSLTSVHITDIAAWCAISFGSSASLSNPLRYAHNLYLGEELITNLIIPNGVIHIKDEAFSKCTCLTSVSIPHSVTSIGENAFYDCNNMTSLTIESGVKSIGESAFSSCKGLTSLEIPNSVTSIGDGAFQDCQGLASVIIGNGVTTIGDYAFNNCISMTSLSIGSGVTNIGDYAFYYCNSLNTIINHATTPQTITSGVFGNVNKSTCTLSVPKHSVDLYQSADVWQDFVHIDAILQSFTVQFFDWDNTLLSADEVEEDDTATPPANPSRIGYTFTGWDTDFSSVTEDLIVTAQYTINRYKVDFVDWDNTLLKTDSVNYGSAATPPANPSRVGYTFSSWDKDFSNITADLTVKAQYTINHYQVDFLDWDGTLLKTENVEYGSAATPPANPSRDWYTFTGWDKDFSNITADLTVTAQYEEGQTLDNTIFFINGTNDSEISNQAIEIDFPTPPTIAGFTFLKWRVLAGDIDDGIQIQAVYQSNMPTFAPEVYANPANPAQKLIRDGNVYILRGDKVYTLQGQEVR